ncbi:MAG: NAD(P)H-dependent oxidoreductase [Pseudomonadota bacterium]
MNIIAFAASNSSRSINARLVSYTASLIENTHDAATVEVIGISDYDMPIFSIDLEERDGVPAAAQAFLDKLGSADAIVISFAEHNGLYTAAYKSLFDWASRLERYVYQQKPMLLMATSPGGRGGKSVLDLATSAAPRFGGEVIATFSLPKFTEHFDEQLEVISDPTFNGEHREAVEALLAHLERKETSS